MSHRKIAFHRIADSALRNADTIVQRWLPGGRREGREWIVVNPTRGDARPGSFKVNLTTGRWSDFATGDRGGDLISLAAYVFKIGQVDAAQRVAAMLSVDVYE
ncbi:MAG: hypothetical protein R3D69_06440 [Xanthobacteraceae bacterium]